MSDLDAIIRETVRTIFKDASVGVAFNKRCKLARIVKERREGFDRPSVPDPEGAYMLRVYNQNLHRYIREAING